MDITPAGFFWENPHLLMPGVFDDYYGIDWEMAEDYADKNIIKTDPSLPPRDVDDEYGRYIRRTFGLSDMWFCGTESLYRDLSSGTWFWFEGITEDGRLHFVGPRTTAHRYIPVETWLGALQKRVANDTGSRSRLWLPEVFSPQSQLKTNEALSKAIEPILIAIKKEKQSIQDISWRLLEEIVAELLRAKGLKIYVTPKSRDGGRDIVAQGELVSGEHMSIAVEVKQKPVVGIADVQRALKANEDFPSLMIVTSGRFSSGVVREKQRSRHELRLFLKDGIALSQWIDAYSKTKRHEPR